MNNRLVLYAIAAYSFVYGANCAQLKPSFMTKLDNGSVTTVASINTDRLYAIDRDTEDISRTPYCVMLSRVLADVGKKFGDVSFGQLGQESVDDHVEKHVICDNGTQEILISRKNLRGGTTTAVNAVQHYKATCDVLRKTEIKSDAPLTFKAVLDFKLKALEVMSSKADPLYLLAHALLLANTVHYKMENEARGGSAAKQVVTLMYSYGNNGIPYGVEIHDVKVTSKNDKAHGKDFCFITAYPVKRGDVKLYGREVLAIKPVRQWGLSILGILKNVDSESFSPLAQECKDATTNDAVSGRWFKDRYESD